LSCGRLSYGGLLLSTPRPSAVVLPRPRFAAKHCQDDSVSSRPTSAPKDRQLCVEGVFVGAVVSCQMRWSLRMQAVQPPVPSPRRARRSGNVLRSYRAMAAPLFSRRGRSAAYPSSLSVRRRQPIHRFVVTAWVDCATAAIRRSCRQKTLRFPEQRIFAKPRDQQASPSSPTSQQRSGLLYR
jgi:hypothetical protein